MNEQIRKEFEQDFPLPEGFEFNSRLNIYMAGVQSKPSVGDYNNKWRGFQAAHARYAGTPAQPKVPDDVLVKAAAYLQQAAEDVAGWGAYASEYFQNKHDLKFNIALYHQRAAELEAILSAQEPKP
jgi:hypothetical protein